MKIPKIMVLKKDLSLKKIKDFHLIGGFVLILLLLIGVSAFTSQIVYKKVIVHQIDTVYAESNDIDFTREFLYDKYKAANDVGFYFSLRATAARLNIPYEWLTYLAYAESRLDSKAKNPKGSAFGLHQITKRACENIDVDYNKYIKMSPYEQLLVSEKYLKQYKKGFSSFGELYSFLYLPLIIDKPNNYKIPQKYLDANPGYHTYNTVGKFKAAVTATFQKELAKY